MHKFWCKKADNVFQPKFLTSWTNGHFFLQNFPRVSEITEYTTYMFSSKIGDIAYWSKFLTSRDQRHFCTKFTRFLFLSKEFSILFLDHQICYLLVLVQKRQHCIHVKILYQSNKRTFSNKLCLFFFSYYLYRIIQMYLRSLNILPTCFQAKLVTLHSGRNS